MAHHLIPKVITYPPLNLYHCELTVEDRLEIQFILHNTQAQREEIERDRGYWDGLNRAGRHEMESERMEEVISLYEQILDNNLGE